MRLSLGPDGAMQAHIKAAGSDTEHSVRIPITENGAKYLHYLLVEQTKKAPQTIGNPGSPTQYDADLWLRKDAAKKADVAFPDINRKNLGINL